MKSFTLLLVSVVLLALASASVFSTKDLDCNKVAKLNKAQWEIILKHDSALATELKAKCDKHPRVHAAADPTEIPIDDPVEPPTEEPVDSPIEPPVEPPSAPTPTISIDVQLNSKNHHTSLYKITEKVSLVIRRGDPLIVTVSNVDSSDLQFQLGGVSLKVASVNNDQVSLAIPINFAVGLHSFSISSPITQQFGDIAVICNPWNSADQVFMDDEASRQEYVLGDTGRIWFGDVLRGGLRGAGSMAWTYDQYEVFDIVLTAFEQIPKSSRSDALKFSRELTWRLNSVKNPSGLLAGNWGGDFSGGTPPTTWTGSGAIYKEWVSRGQRPARYGQCWVFGGTLTTALRSLGVPSRPLTNFRSAHDSPPYDGVIEQENGESIWNFHVWVDAWMKRGNKFTWNAVDSTPQESSDGHLQMGPANVMSVKSRIRENWDTPFVISEVVAKVWLGSGPYDESEDHTDQEFDYEDVGRFMSTKKLGCVTRNDRHDCREDITSSYKTKSRGPHLAGVTDQKLLTFKADISPARPQIGEDFIVSLRRGPNFKYTSATTAKVSVRVYSMTYNGVIISQVKNFAKEIPVEGVTSEDPENFENLFELVVPEEDYIEYVPYGNGIRVQVQVDCEGISYRFQRQFQLSVPPITVTVSNDAPEVGEAFTAYLTFPNPLEVPLTGVVLHANLPSGARTIPLPDIPALGQMTATVEDIELTKTGLSAIVFSLQTQELLYIYGSQEFEI